MSHARAAWAATVAYTLLTLVMTWPLVTVLAREFPADLGDSLLNAWILGWGAESIAGMAAGATSFRDYWNAGIFHPSPLALAYSEHLFAQAVQILPVYFATDNLILCYNLVILSSFVLSGLGMYLLVADVTGSRAAAFVAGLFYAFVPYRTASLAHVQVLSSQWMPFALLGFRRFVATGRWRPLAGGTAAFIAQALSCGYYLLYFGIVLPVFVLIEMAIRRVLLDSRRWVGLAASAGVTAACTLPFLFPYLELRALEDFRRTIGEIRSFSPDLLGYLTATESLWIWGGRLRAAPGPEGELFLGAVPMALAAAALALAIRDAWCTARGVPRGDRRVRVLVSILLVAAGSAAVALVVLATAGRVRGTVFGIAYRMTDPYRPLIALLVATAGALGLSRRVRAGARALVMSPGVVALGLALFAVAMSLGPSPQIAGDRVSWLPMYQWALAYVPGIDGLRVPARFAMIAAMFLAMAAGVTLARVARTGRAGQALLALCAAAFLVEAAAMPIDISRRWGSGDYRDAPGVRPGPDAPPLYRYLASLPRDSIVLELPLGDGGWDLRAVYYAGVHRLRTANGYSGGFPRAYEWRQAAIASLASRPDEAWHGIRSSGATHIVLHEHAYWGDRATRVRAFLLAHGATLVRDFGEGETLYLVNR